MCWTLGRWRWARGDPSPPGTHLQTREVSGDVISSFVVQALVDLGEKPVTADVSEVTVWYRKIFLQNMALVVMVMSLLHNARDKEITHSHGRQKKTSLLFKYWRKTVGHGVILFIESYKWQLNEKWNQTLTSTKMWMVNPALSENVLQFGRDWAWARANTENQPENPEKTKCIPVDLPTGISLCNSPPPFPKGAIPGPWGWGRDGESWGRQARWVLQ